MKLTELEPRWIVLDGRKVGMLFRCPHCRETWLSCFFEKMPILNGGQWPNQVALFKTLVGEDEAHNVVPCKKDKAWNLAGADLSNLFDFSTLTVTPSLDASASGHWHGFITNGAAR
jgi:hypothetical protein